MLETFIRLVTLIPRPIGRAIVAPLRILPGFRHAMRVMNYVREIDKLEDDSDFQAARALRQKSLNDVPARYSAPLWRSEGFDRLRFGNPVEALEAFEIGIGHLEGSAAMVGLSRPDELYYGAAWAALDAGELQKARGYYRRAANSVTAIRRFVKLPEEPRWFTEGLATLRRRLGEPTRA